MRAMPELAEVEFFRRCWDQGVGQRIQRVHLHSGKRIFRNAPVAEMEKGLSGSVLLGSEARGKRLLFRFSRELWLGLHLGMSGKLKAEPPRFTPEKHDHLVL